MSVPLKDFVLYLRDEMVSKPVGLLQVLPDGDQAFSISILPDMLSVKERAKIVSNYKKESGITVDVERRFNQRDLDPQDEDFGEEEIKSGIKKEYIFLVDQSGSMAGGTIKLARSALLLFIQSLTVGSLFNICSFGSVFKFMFPGNSVPYT